MFSEFTILCSKTAKYSSGFHISRNGHNVCKYVFHTVQVLDQVYHEVSATRSRTLFDLIFWLEDHFGSHKNFGSRGVSAAFAKYEQMFNSGAKHKFSVLRN